MQTFSFEHIGQIDVKESEKAFDEILQNAVNDKIQNQMCNVKSKCATCGKEIENISMYTNQMIILRTVFKGSCDMTVKIPLSKIPRSVLIGNKAFHVMYCINYKDNNHFNTFVNDNSGNVIYIDDLPQREQIIKKEEMDNWTIFPVVLVLISYT